MARKGSDAGALILIGLGALVWLIAKMPKEVWEFLFGAGVVALILWIFLKPAKKSAESNPQHAAIYPRRPPSINYRPNSYSIPEDPRGAQITTKWIPLNEAVTVSSLTIPGGLLFLGSTLKAPNGNSEPSQIDPRYTVAQDPVDVSQRLMNYWPSYTDISPQARRAYLQWLADSRITLNADVGYVFLFFYGLERRALVDAKTNSQARAEIPLIITEIRRLQDIYGQNGSFRHYSSRLIDLLELQHDAGHTDETAPPIYSSHREIPLRLRIGLGQMAVKQRPVPFEWAFAWVICDPNIRVPKGLLNVMSIFKELFVEKYADKFGDGMKLAINRTKLRVAYRPASPGLMNVNIAVNVGDIPDVTVVTTPVKRLQGIVDECLAELSVYSRYVSKHPGHIDRLESFALLPMQLWPDSARSSFDSLKARVAHDFVSTNLKELFTLLGSAAPTSHDQIVALQTSLEKANIAMEPDIVGGDRTPKDTDTVVLFSATLDDRAARSSPAYQAAAVTLDLAAGVAAADGDFSGSEVRTIGDYIDSWIHLSLAHRTCLKARLKRLISTPPPLASLKKRLEPLSSDARRVIASFLAHLAHADGSVDPSEVKLLERIYKALGIDVQVLYSDLHANNMTSTGVPAPPSRTSGGMKAAVPKSDSVISLDPARIAALQKETEQVSRLLAGVFAEETASVQTSAQVETAPVESTEPRILGLDPELSAFLRTLLSRSTWTRAELNDLAKDMHIMLDGALERVNEAAFDHADGPLTEGEDPIEINREILETLSI